MSLFKPVPQSQLHIQDSEETFPIHRIYCVGRNYADHAKEMGMDAREAPFFFCKPADAVVPARGKILNLNFPGQTNNLHHEAELVVALDSGGKDLNAQQARGCIAGYAIGLDMTRRDLQTEAKNAGRPWEIAKAFDQSAPISALVLTKELYREGMLQLWKNTELKQSADVSSMIWAVDEIIVELSKYFELRSGDLIFTGTPAGVGPVQPGDALKVSLAHIGMLEVNYRA